MRVLLSTTSTRPYCVLIDKDMLQCFFNISIFWRKLLEHTNPLLVDIYEYFRLQDRMKLSLINMDQVDNFSSNDLPHFFIVFNFFPILKTFIGTHTLESNFFSFSSICEYFFFINMIRLTTSLPMIFSCASLSFNISISFKDNSLRQKIYLEKIKFDIIFVKQIKD